MCLYNTPSIRCTRAPAGPRVAPLRGKKLAKNHARGARVATCKHFEHMRSYNTHALSLMSLTLSQYSMYARAIMTLYALTPIKHTEHARVIYYHSQPAVAVRACRHFMQILFKKRKYLLTKHQRGSVACACTHICSFSCTFKQSP